MKKILFWFCFLSLMGVVLYFFLRPLPPDSQQSYYADFLPDETVALLAFYDMEGLSERFPHTPLGHFLSPPNMHEMMRELGAVDEELYKYDDFYQSIAGMMTSPLLAQIFGDDAVIALCPPDLELVKENPEQEVKTNLLAFATSSTAGPISKLARLVMWQDVTNTAVGGLDMTRIVLDEEEVLYGYDDQGIILLAYDPEQIVEAVQRKKSRQNLKYSEDFLATEAFWQEEAQAKVYARSYVNPTLLQEFFAAFAQEGKKDISQKSLERLAGMEGMGGMLVEKQGEFRVRVKGKARPHEKQTGKGASTQTALTSSLLQKDTLLHYRMTDFDKTFFRAFFSPAKGGHQYQELEKSVQKSMGFSLDKLLEALGPRAGVSVHKLVNAGLFPLPKTVFAFQVQNKKSAGWALRRLRDSLKRQGFQERYEKVQGHRLYYWSMMPMEATHLAILLTDSMLYIANGESQLRALLAEQQSPEVLTENMVKELGKTAGTCVANANISAFLFRPKRLADQLAPVADWLTDMMLASGTSSGKKTQEQVFALMRSVDVIAACSERTETEARGELIIQAWPAAQKKRQEEEERKKEKR